MRILLDCGVSLLVIMDSSVDLFVLLGLISVMCFFLNNFYL